MTVSFATCRSARTGLKCRSTLLLINLLLDSPLPENQYRSDLCYFLTDRGCSLRAKPVICVNFVCSRIRENIPFQTLVHLQRIIGDELDTLFRIEEYVKRKISDRKKITECPICLRICFGYLLMSAYQHFP